MTAAVIHRLDRGIKIPFISTGPITDVCLMFILIPVWWLLGLEQFIWLPLLTWSTVKMLLANGSFRYQPTLLLAVVFVAASLPSLLSVDEPIRYISFARTLTSYVSALLMFFVITNAVSKWGDLHRILRSVVLSLTFVGILGLLAATGVISLTIRTPLGLVLPDVVASTELGSRMIVRSFGSTSWFSYFGEYFRLRGTFLFATMYAAALAISVPLAVLCLRYARGASRLLFAFAILVLLGNLILTTGRMGLLALLAGMFLWLLLNPRLSPMTRALLGLVTLLSAVLIIGLASFSPSSEMTEFLHARGSSTSDRLQIYQETLKGIAERPLLGWGTQRDVEGLPYPAGSHSSFLGAFYRHGILGGCLFIAIWVSTWLAGLGTREARRHPALNDLRWALLVATCISLTEVVDLDVVTFSITWVVIAGVHASTKLINLETRSADAVAEQLLST